MSQQVQQLLESHPQWTAVQAIYHTLRANGYKAFLAGGCVRDALLGVPANDLDLATDATPDQLEGLFARTVNVGKAFGVIRVLEQDQDIEVATFRTDGKYKDGRRPEDVQFSSPAEDARRRDFTVNALFFDLEKKTVVDYVDGIQDLGKKILRTVGDAKKRFGEDHLRLLRAARFVAQLNFDLEHKTLQSLQDMAALVKTVSGERLRDEMIKMLKSAAVLRGLKVMQETGMLEVLFPFRLRNNSWNAELQGREAWQNLALFFRSAQEVELKQGFQLLKLSSKEQREIERAWILWQRPAAFFALSIGKKLSKMPEPGTAWAVAILAQEHSLFLAEIKVLQQAWQAWNAQLPKPFLNGEDLQGKLTGKAIGACLAEAFELQLERQLNDREQSLEWLKAYLEKESHGV
ncbi:MAG: CCA tRNA nucleotidyltransferase [Bdellovibrio sp.]|nr:CCA tRNA nucleotidyltransferase [Bdellovibrio sp.]